MKKFVKISLITAGILAALGCICCMISVLAGGKSLIYWVNNDERLQAQLEETGNAVENAIENISDGKLHLVFKDNKVLVGNDEYAQMVQINEDRSYSAQDVKRLNLVLGAGVFTVKEKEVSDGNIEIHVQGVGECETFVKDQTLYVEGFQGIDIAVFGHTEFKNEITIEIPANMTFEEVNVEVGAGIMDISSLEARELDAQIGAGELRLNNIVAGELSAEIGAGRMDAQNVTAQEAEFSVSMGECIYNGIIKRELDAECDMGNMELMLEGNREDYNYEIECSAGNIEVDKSSWHALGMEKSINNGAAGTIDLTCNMGNITVSFSNGK